MLVNFPNKDTVLKNYLETNLYKMVENLFAFNINDTNRIKEKYLKEYLINLSIINYLMHISFKKKYISYKQAEEVSNIITDLKKITTSLLKGVSND